MNKFMNAKEQVIHKWITSLMTATQDDSLIDDFHIEDGMNFKEYWDYEFNNFKNLSSIFDLDENFHIQIMYEYAIENNKTICFIYLKNSKDLIVCKMNITLKENNGFFISSNNFFSQLVPKHHIHNEVIIGLGLAIKTKYPLHNIKSAQLQLLHLNRASNFNDDGFSTARFENDNQEVITFYVQMINNNQYITEKRKIFFDQVDNNLKPYCLENNILTLIDSNYPVHLALYGENSLDKTYPRNISIDITKYTSAIITDCLDNDWSFDLLTNPM